VLPAAKKKAVRMTAAEMAAENERMLAEMQARRPVQKAEDVQDPEPEADSGQEPSDAGEERLFPEM
jgi:hypothetical protein